MSWSMIMISNPRHSQMIKRTKKVLGINVCRCSQLSEMPVVPGSHPTGNIPYIFVKIRVMFFCFIMIQGKNT